MSADERPQCHHDAVIHSQEQAAYVAGSVAQEFGGTWEAEQCGSHWHARERLRAEQGAEQ